MEIFNFFDDDEEFIEFLEWERKPYVVRERRNPFNEYDENEFFIRFRLTKETVLFILEQIEEQIETITDRNHSVSPINQLLVTLRYYASGSFYVVAGDLINISKTTTCRIIHKVTRALASLAPTYIQMPSTEEEVDQAKEAFFTKARLPRVIGSLDCTHIKIQRPSGPHQETFRNRKSYFSLNVQTIASTNLQILYIVASWPGSTHDQIFFDNSNVRSRLVANEFGNSVLVADNGYANTKYVITPFVQPHTEMEQIYNEAVTRTRNPVERQYGLRKRRFPILAVGLRSQLRHAMGVIVAYAVVHNIAIEQKEDLYRPTTSKLLGKG